MRNYYTVFLALILFTELTAQVEYKIDILPDNITYQVSLVPSTNWNAPLNATSSAQITILAPTGGFVVSNINSLAGLWNNGVNISAPDENPTMDYFIFSLQGATSSITYQDGIEVPLFTFENSGSCTGPLQLLENNTDPFWPPNSQNVNVGNQISVIGAGPGVNAYQGNQLGNGANCNTDTNPCGYSVDDIILTSPSTCGFADGSIEFVVTITDLPVQYSINGGTTWQNEALFSNLAAGDIFELVVRDIAAICIEDQGEYELDAPLAAAVTNLQVIDTECEGTTGSISFDAFSEDGGLLEYSIDDQMTWQLESNYTGLAAGIYPTWVRNSANNCTSLIGELEVDEDCSGNEDCPVLFEIEEISENIFEVSMTPYITWTFPNNITSSAQVTIKVPTGGFEVSNIQSQINNVIWSLNSSYLAPSEDPGSDYISIGLSSFGTQNIPYTENEKIALFTFENTGSCPGGFIQLMDNATDLFFPPNSENANVGQQLTVSGFGSADMPVCIDNANLIECSGGGCPQILISGDQNEICEGETVQLSVFGPTENITWTPTGSLSCTDCLEPMASPVQTTTYTVLYDDGADCQITDNFTITVNPIPTISNVAVSSAGDCQVGTGQISISLSNAGAFEYSINNGISWSNEGVFNDLDNGDYQILVRSANGDCEVSYPQNPVSIEIGDGPEISEVTFNDPSACGLSDGAITIQTLNSGDWMYSIDGGNSFQSDPTFSNLTGGTYNIVVSDNSQACTTNHSEPISLLTFDMPNILSVEADAPSICGMSNGRIEINADASGTLEYSIDNGMNWESEPIFEGLPGGDFQVFVRIANSNCMVEYPNNPVQLEEANAPAVLNPIDQLNSCDGGSVFVDIELDEGIITFAVNGTGEFFNPEINGNHATFEAVPIGENSTYSVEILGENGCSVVEEFELNSVESPTADFALNQGGCIGEEVSISFTGTSGPSANLIWNLNGGTIISSSPGDGNVPEGADLIVVWDNEGAYDVDLTVSENGCENSFQQNITINDFNMDIEMNIQDLNACNGNDGSIEITPSIDGNYSFLWNGPNGYSSEDQNIDGLSEGQYQLTITEVQSGCELAFEAAIQAPSALELTSLVAETDFGCDASTGTLSVELNNGAPPYVVNLFDANDPDVLLNGLTSMVGTINIPLLEVGSYNLMIADDQGCILEESFNIEANSSEPPTLDFSNLTMASCGSTNGSFTLEIDGADAPYSYDYLINFQPVASDVELDSNSELFDNLSAGNYTLIVTGNTGCSSTLNVLIEEEGGPQIMIENIENVECAGEATGSITFFVDGTGSFNFEIDQDIADGSVQGGDMVTIDGIPMGIFNLNVFNQDNDCTAVMPFIIEQNNPMQIIAVSDAPSGCDIHDAQICIEITGGNGPYTITSDLGTAPTSTIDFDGCITELYNEQVNIVITDAIGCEVELQVTLNEFEVPSLSLSDLNILNSECADEPSGTISSLSGNNYSVLDSTGLLIGMTPITSLSAGTYTLMETLGDCTAMVEVEILGNDPLDISVNTIAESCEFNDGSISISVEGNEANYLFEWENINSDSSTIFNLSSNQNYAVTITDTLGCSTILENLMVELDCEDVPAPTGDTIYVEVVLGTTEFICVNKDQLTGNSISINNLCEDRHTGNSAYTFVDNQCITIEGLILGEDFLCIEICDDSGNCQTTIVIIEVVDRQLVIYNGFSPNRDGVNDFFTIKNIEFFPDNSLLIYSRWGNKVYEANGYNNSWEGTFDGKNLPDGTYFFMLDDGMGSQYNGYLQILR